MNLLVSIEGGEYVGKTSLVAPALKKIFNVLGFTCEVSREPGGTKEAEKARKEIFQKAKEGADAKTLALLFNKARKIHIDDFIMPFFEKYKDNKPIVILDRYLDSTRVYQGLEGGLGIPEIKRLEKEFVGGLFPDLTLILYFPEEIFRELLSSRKVEKRETTTWDKSDFETHLMRQRYYLMLPSIAFEWGERRDFAQINASEKPSDVVLQSLIACIPQLIKSDPSLSKEKILQVYYKLKKEEFFNNLIHSE